MQILSQEPTRWQKVDQGVYQRTKNGRITVYKRGQILGTGLRASVYELLPIDGGKQKALKISSCSFSALDTTVSRQIHSQGLADGIIKPSKAFFNQDNLWYTILPKYEGSLKQLLIDKKISELELVQGLQQVLSGLKHLHRTQIAHCDLYLANILVGTWKGKRRFDIADFERSLDFSGLTKTEEFFKEFKIRELNVLCEAVAASRSNNLLISCRVILLRLDIFMFGRLLTAVKPYLQSKLIEMLGKLGERIKDTKSLDLVQETLIQIESG